MTAGVFKRCMTGLFAAGSIGVGLSSCGEFEGCGEFEESSSPSAPRVLGVELAPPLDDDPLLLVFAVDFADSDGDLRGGEALVHIDAAERPSIAIPLDDVYRQSAVASEAREGTLALVVRLTEVVEDGADLRISFRLVDEDGQSSNCFPMELEFAVTTTSRRVRPSE